MFWAKFAKSERFLSKSANMSTTIQFRILELVFMSTFRSDNRTNSKNKHHHGVLITLISTSSKFQDKCFGANLPKMGSSVRNGGNGTLWARNVTLKN